MSKTEESLSSRNLHSDAGMEPLLQTHQCDGQMCEKTDKTHFKALGEKKNIKKDKVKMKQIQTALSGLNNLKAQSTGF